MPIWNGQRVYETLGFEEEGIKEPVTFVVDGETWKRFPVRSGMTDVRSDMAGHNNIDGTYGNLFFRNFGSRKFRLKLTEYK